MYWKYIFTVFFLFDEKYKKKVHTFSDKFNKKSSLDLMKLTSDIFYRKAEFYIIINRYPVFVNDIKKTIKNEFNQNPTSLPSIS